jgi:hypothetical protein
MSINDLRLANSTHNDGVLMWNRLLLSLQKINRTILVFEMQHLISQIHLGRPSSSFRDIELSYRIQFWVERELMNSISYLLDDF